MSHHEACRVLVSWPGIEPWAQQWKCHVLTTGGGDGLVPKSCPTLCDPMDCSPPGSSVHGILQAGILEWVAISCSRGSSWPRDRTRVSYTAGRFFTTEPPGKPPNHWIAREFLLSNLEFHDISQWRRALSTLMHLTLKHCMSNPTWVWGPTLWLRKGEKQENKHHLCLQAKMSSSRWSEWELVTWQGARPQQIHDILMAAQVGHHFEFRHESLSLRAVCFFCQWQGITNEKRK